MVYGLHTAAERKPARSQQQLNLVQKTGPERRDALHHQAHKPVCFSSFSSLPPPALLESTVTSSLASRGTKIELSRCCKAPDRG